MEDFSKASNRYFETLRDRAKKSRVYKPYQMTGLMLAEILDDAEHKSLYMRLSRQYDSSDLLRLAKNLEERKNIQNKGAYFMRMIKTLDKLPEAETHDTLDHTQ